MAQTISVFLLSVDFIPIGDAQTRIKIAKRMKNISVEKVYFLQGISNFVGSKFVKKELTKCFFVI